MARRSLESGMERHGAFREAARDAIAAFGHRADRADLRARLCRFPLCRLRLAQGLSEARRLSRKNAHPALGQGLAAVAGLDHDPWIESDHDLTPLFEHVPFGEPVPALRSRS